MKAAPKIQPIDHDLPKLGVCVDTASDFEVAQFLHDPIYWKAGMFPSASAAEHSFLVDGPLNLGIASSREMKILSLYWTRTAQIPVDVSGNAPTPDALLAVAQRAENMIGERPVLVPLGGNGNLLLMAPYVPLVLVWNEKKNPPLQFPDRVWDSDFKSFLPQHPFTLDIFCRLAQEAIQRIPEPVRQVFAYEHKNFQTRLLFWLLLGGFPYRGLATSSRIQTSHLAESAGVLAKTAGDIVLRVKDGQLVTLAEMGDIYLENINPQNADAWAEVLTQQANLMRSKAAVLDVYAQAAKMHKADTQIDS